MYRNTSLFPLPIFRNINFTGITFVMGKIKRKTPNKKKWAKKSNILLFDFVQCKGSLKQNLFLRQLRIISLLTYNMKYKYIGTKHFLRYLDISFEFVLKQIDIILLNKLVVLVAKQTLVYGYVTVRILWQIMTLNFIFKVRDSFRWKINNKITSFLYLF